MDLEIQIQTLAFSFFYGMFVALLFNLFYSILFKTKTFIKILSSICFIFVVNTLYFYILLKINSGVLTIYALIAFLIGFLISNKTTKRIRYKIKKDIFSKWRYFFNWNDIIQKV